MLNSPTCMMVKFVRATQLKHMPRNGHMQVKLNAVTLLSPVRRYVLEMMTLIVDQVRARRDVLSLGVMQHIFHGRAAAHMRSSSYAISQIIK